MSPGRAEALDAKSRSFYTATYQREIVHNTDGSISSLIIRTTSPVTLTAHADSKAPGAIPLLGSIDYDLAVYGDEVAVEGIISAPGHSVTMFARVLTGLDWVRGHAKVGPAIDVSAPEKPQQLPKTPQKFDPVAHCGESGNINIWWPLPREQAAD